MRFFAGSPRALVTKYPVLGANGNVEPGGRALPGAKKPIGDSIGVPRLEEASRGVPSVLLPDASVP